MSISIGSTNAFIDLLASPWTEEAKKPFVCYLQLLCFLCRGEREIYWRFLKRQSLTWERRENFPVFTGESKYQIWLLYWSLPKISNECSSLLTKNYGTVTFPVSSKSSLNSPHIHRYNKIITCRSECCQKVYVINPIYLFS